MGDVKKVGRKVTKPFEKAGKKVGKEAERLSETRAGGLALYSADPAGLVATAKDPKVAALQERSDILGYGAKPRAQQKKLKEKEAEQEAVIAEEKRQLEAEEEKRKKRIAKGRQGRRSLLYAGGTEAGVSLTLGG